MPDFATQVNTSLKMRTTLTDSTIADCARSAAQGLTGDQMKFVVRDETSSSTALLELEMRPRVGAFGNQQLGLVQVARNSADVLEVSLVSETVRVEQAKFLLIPISPKRVHGWGLYSKYLDEVRQAILKADPRAQAV